MSADKADTDKYFPDGHVAEEARKNGLAPEDVKIILMTHLHPDHFGGLVTTEGKAQFPNADIYVSRVERTYWVDEVMPGVKAMDTSGHTPGHVSFMLEQDGENMMILGDLIHFPAIQLPIPEVAVVFDVDPAKAIQTRKRVFDFVSENNISVAGMHIPFPGIMSIKKAAEGYEER